MTGSGGFHDGELSVQRRAGVRLAASRLSGMLAPAGLSGGASRFLRERTLAALTARDHGGRLWISPLAGFPGFLSGDGTALRIAAAPAAGDPLYQLAAGQPAGLLIIDFATRRRMRVNGTLSVAAADVLEIDGDQAFGNCPQYIQRRQLEPVPPGNPETPGPARWSTTLDAGQAALIEQADTFFLGTTHPDRGNDASHRGGTAGFVRLDGASLWWPDYPGNNLFNSLGNLAVDDTAALLFADFAGRTALYLTGQAVIEWIPPGSAGDDGGTGRRIRFTFRDVVHGRLPAVSEPGVIPSPHNPPPTGWAAQ